MSNAHAGIAVLFAAALVAVSCGGGGGSSTPPTSSTATGSTTDGNTPSADVVITIAGMAFNPNKVTVTAGQTVAWKNDDSMAHTATQDQGAFDTGTIPPGATSKAITISGTSALTYHCSVHPGMVGALNGSAGTPGY